MHFLQYHSVAVILLSNLMLKTLANNKHSDYCKRNKEIFGSNCPYRGDNEQNHKFCTDFARLCAEQQFCDENRPNFEQNCLDSVLNPSHTILCVEYSRKCKQRIALPQRFRPFTLPTRVPDSSPSGVTTQPEVIDPLDPSDPESSIDHDLGDTEKELQQTFKEIISPTKIVPATCESEKPLFDLECRSATVKMAYGFYCGDMEKKCGWLAGPLSSFSPGMSDEDKRRYCKSYEDAAYLRCYATRQGIRPNHREDCSAYTRDCWKYYYDDQLLKKIVSLANGGARVVPRGNWYVSGLPIVETIGLAGNENRVAYGAWGGGYQETGGVPPFWITRTAAGANWFDGGYGFETGWEAPFVSGSDGVVVNVPLRSFLGQRPNPWPRRPGAFFEPHRK